MEAMEKWDANTTYEVEEIMLGWHLFFHIFNLHVVINNFSMSTMPWVHNEREAQHIVVEAPKSGHACKKLSNPMGGLL